MAKKAYKIVRLMPNVSSWCDLENNIYLTKPNKTFKRIKDDCDMKMINKGVKAGLISLEEHFEEVKEPKAIVKEAKSKIKSKKVQEEPVKECDVEIKVDVAPVKPVEVIEQPEEVKEDDLDKSDK